MWAQRGIGRLPASTFRKEIPPVRSLAILCGWRAMVISGRPRNTSYPLRMDRGFRIVLATNCKLRKAEKWFWAANIYSLIGNRLFELFTLQGIRRLFGCACRSEERRVG